MIWKTWKHPNSPNSFQRLTNEGKFQKYLLTTHMQIDKGCRLITCSKYCTHEKWQRDGLLHDTTVNVLFSLQIKKFCQTQRSLHDNCDLPLRLCLLFATIGLPWAVVTVGPVIFLDLLTKADRREILSHPVPKWLFGEPMDNNNAAANHLSTFRVLNGNQARSFLHPS